MNFDELLVAFWPSIQELHETPLTSHYYGSLQEFYDSLYELRKGLKQNGVGFQRWLDIFTEKGNPVSHDTPPVIAEIVLYISTIDNPAALYKLLRRWLDSKNGRIIRVKMGEFEVEVSRMSEGQFMSFLQILDEQKGFDEKSSRSRKTRKRPGRRIKELRAKLVSEAFVLVDVNSKERILEEQEVRHVATEHIKSPGAIVDAE
jgi:hypothetical protein